MNIDIQNILKISFFQNTVLQYLISVGIFFVGLVVLKFIKIIVIQYLKKLSQKTETTFDNFLIENIEKTVVPMLYFGAFYIALHNLKFTEAIDKGINALGAIIITLLGIRFAISVLSQLLENYWLKTYQHEAKEKSLKGLLVIGKFLIWGVGIIFLLDNLGFKISTVIAGLGVGGIAVALAAQTVLGDLFSYVSILFDRPFEVGDFITVDDQLGTVEHIGIKTTRLTSLSGEQLIFSNTDLTGSRIRNYKRMLRRRVVFKIGVIYQTKLEHLQEIPQMIKGIIESVNDTAFDRSHFQAYGDFSLDFETVYYVVGNDYNKYMDIHQKVNLKIFEEFSKRGIEFAYPTQTLFVEKS